MDIISYRISGGITDENPALLAEVSDKSGINTVGNGIGHDITSILDTNNEDSRVLNEYYESDLNTYKSGRILYPYYKLSEGNHTIKLKVWDAQNNSSEASIDFIVTSSASFALEQLMNFPNPFVDRTYFTFQHNQTDQYLDINIRIFDISGQLVRKIEESVYAGGYKLDPIEWDGTDEGGNLISRGCYVYNVEVRNSEGSIVSKSEKLVFIR